MTDLRKAAEMAAYEVPLHELLERVPENARLVIDSEDGMSTRFIPVGHLCKQAAKALRQALAQEQEPVAFYVYKPTLPHGNLGNVSDGDLPWVYDQDPSSGYSARMLVYTAPPKREWVGLTEDEAFACQERDYFETYKNIDSKLKEKNT